MKNTVFKKLGIVVVIFAISLILPLSASAAKKSKGISADDLKSINSTVNVLMKKIYASSLFSPQDNENLIDIKLKLDEGMEATPDPSMAKLYYNLGYIYLEREYRDDAIDCFQTVLNSFSNSPYATKALNELKKMGVKIETPGSDTTGK